MAFKQGDKVVLLDDTEKALRIMDDCSVNRKIREIMSSGRICTVSKIISEISLKLEEFRDYPANNIPIEALKLYDEMFESLKRESVQL